jgi:hypothetical protein
MIPILQSIPKHPYAFGLLLLMAQHPYAIAQSSAETVAAEDSIREHDLGEIVIKAPKVLHKADMDVYQPNSSTIMGRATRTTTITGAAAQAPRSRIGGAR